MLASFNLKKKTCRTHSHQRRLHFAKAYHSPALIPKCHDMTAVEVHFAAFTPPQSATGDQNGEELPSINAATHDICAAAPFIS